MEWLRNIEFAGALASIVGLLIGIPGLVIAFVQLHRTEKAAEAAFLDGPRMFLSASSSVFP
jgi:hypothetical protein